MDSRMDLLNGARKKVLERYHSMSSLEDDEDASLRLITDLPAAFWEKSCSEDGCDVETASGSESSYDTERSDESGGKMDNSDLVPSLEDVGEEVRNHISHLNSKINSLNRYINKLHSDCDFSMNRNSVLEERLYKSDEEIEFYRDLFYASKLQRTTIFITIPVVSREEIRKYHFISNVLESYGKTDGKINAVGRIETSRTMPNTDINNMMDKRNNHNNMDKRDTGLDMKDGMDEKEKTDDRMNKKENSIGTEENRNIMDKNGIYKDNRNNMDKKDNKMNKKDNKMNKKDNRMNKKDNKKDNRMNKKDNRMNKKGNNIGKEERRNDTDKEVDSNGMDMGDARRMINDKNDGCDRIDKVGDRQNRINDRFNTGNKRVSNYLLNKYKKLPPIEKVSRIQSQKPDSKMSSTKATNSSKTITNQRQNQVPLTNEQGALNKITRPKIMRRDDSANEFPRITKKIQKGPALPSLIKSVPPLPNMYKPKPSPIKSVPLPPLPNMYKPKPSLIKSVPPLPNMYKPKPSLIKSVPPLPNMYKPKPPSGKQTKRPYAGKSRRLPPISDLKTELEKPKEL